MFPRSRCLKPIWSEWHESRQEARETAFSINEFGESEKVKYDLDTAGITGQDNIKSYKYRPAIDLLGVRGHIVQELPRHD